MRSWLVCLILAACSDKGAAPPPVPERVHHGRHEPITVAVDPNAGAHLDDDVHRGSSETGDPNAARGSGREIDVTLRSSPTGAQAFVDGAPVGSTPTFWSGVADGRPHEFTFELHGFALARYRFVPTTSGVVHARLEPIVEETDAGVALPEATPYTPNAGSALVNPPPSPLKPDAALTPDASSGRGPQP